MRYGPGPVPFRRLGPSVYRMTQVTRTECGRPSSSHFVAVTLLYQITKFLLRRYATWGAPPLRYRLTHGNHVVEKTIDIGKRPFVLRRRNERAPQLVAVRWTATSDATFTILLRPRSRRMPHRRPLRCQRVHCLILSTFSADPIPGLTPAVCTTEVILSVRARSTHFQLSLVGSDRRCHTTRRYHDSMPRSVSSFAAARNRSWSMSQISTAALRPTSGGGRTRYRPHLR